MIAALLMSASIASGGDTARSSAAAARTDANDARSITRARVVTLGYLAWISDAVCKILDELRAARMSRPGL